MGPLHLKTYGGLSLLIGWFSTLRGIRCQWRLSLFMVTASPLDILSTLDSLEIMVQACNLSLLFLHSFLHFPSIKAAFLHYWMYGIKEAGNHMVPAPRHIWIAPSFHHCRLSRLPDVYIWETGSYVAQASHHVRIVAIVARRATSIWWRVACCVIMMLGTALKRMPRMENGAIRLLSLIAEGAKSQQNAAWWLRLPESFPLIG